MKEAGEVLTTVNDSVMQAWLLGTHSRIGKLMGTDVKLAGQERIDRNVALARKMYDAYTNISVVGFPDSWKAEDFEPGWIWEGWSPSSTDERRLRIFSNDALSFEEWDRDEYTAVLGALPDLRTIGPFVAIANEECCSFQLNCGGHDSDGNYHEFNESIYLWTNEQGKIYKLQVFDDWANMIDFVAFMAKRQEMPDPSSESHTRSHDQAPPRP